jgi:2-methylcitrate dehydratase PrpD
VERTLHDPSIARVMARLTAEADGGLDVGAAHLTVRLADGRQLAEHVTAARGTPENPATRDDVEAKFRRLAGVVLPGDRVDRLIDTLRGLRHVPDVAEIATLAAG